MQLNQLVIALLLGAMLSACRIEIKTPTSGAVSTTSGNIDCAVGQLCDIDLVDIYFDEEFIARPASGFVFEEWQDANGQLCRGEAGTCSVSTAVFAGNDFFEKLLSYQNIVAHLTPVFRSTGFHTLFIGHSFFNPIAAAMRGHAAAAGIESHSDERVFNGGPNGAPEAFWNHPDQGPRIKGILDEGDVDLFVMTFHGDYPDDTGYVNWIDYALTNNPHIRIGLALPWGARPASRTTAAYDTSWTAGHDGGWHKLLDRLRAQFPDTEIFCIPYGFSAIELRKLLDAGTLDDVSQLTGAADDAIYTDALGHGGDILKDLAELVWLRAIYGIDLTTYPDTPGYSADLNGIAQTIVDNHDPEYDAPYRSPD